MGGAGLVNYFIAETIAGSEREEIENAIVMLDGARDETRVRQAARIALSRARAARDADYFVKRFTARPAREEDGLQLADMLAGLVMSLSQGQKALPKRLQTKITLREWG